MRIAKIATAIAITTYLVAAHAAPPMDQFKISLKTLRGLVGEGFQVAAYSNSYDPESKVLRAEFVLQKGGSVYLCSDNYRYKVASRQLACYELVEPFNAQDH